MTQKFVHLISSQNLSDSNEYKTVFAFALQQAKHHNSDVTLVINNISRNTCFLEHVFDSKQIKLLSNGEEIRLGNTVVRLKSLKTLKDYESYDVLCAFHAAPETILKMEKSVNPSSIIVLGENIEQHLNDWVNENNVQSLSHWAN